MRLLGLLLCFAATTVFAIDLTKADIDGDGRVSKAEAAGNAELMGIFDRADRDRDGRLTPAEVAAYEKRMKAKADSASAGATKAEKRKAKKS
jgi:hypothetical protein